MIGKPITGKSFGGCIRYLLNRDEAIIIDSEGLQTKNAQTISRDFNIQRTLNPALGKAVGHTILSWSTADNTKLSDEIMTKVCKEYMDKMGIKDTQYLIVKHTDRQHPHIHLVYNRVNNHGQTISDQNNYKRNIKACKAITEAYGFCLASGKQQVNRTQLKGRDQIKYAIHDQANKAIETSRNWAELDHKLQQFGIKIHYTYRGQTDQVQGISFERSGVKFKGSAVDRSLSYTAIQRRFDQKLSKINTILQAKTQISGSRLDTERQQYQPNESIIQSENTRSELLDLLMGYTNTQEYNPFQQDLLKRKKKKKGQQFKR